jgi:hypothetical protein
LADRKQPCLGPVRCDSSGSKSQSGPAGWAESDISVPEKLTLNFCFELPGFKKNVNRATTQVMMKTGKRISRLKFGLRTNTTNQ